MATGEQKFNLIIFDLDGTLVDTEDLHVTSLIVAARERGCELSRETGNVYIIGKPWDRSYQEIQRDHPDLFHSSKALQDACGPHFDQMIASGNVAIPESVTLLEDLARETPVCIVSGSSRAEVAHFVDFLKISKMIAFYLGNDDYPQGKPDPGCFLEAARMADVKPHECLVFEDACAGVVAAKRADMTCVALARERNTQDVSQADLILNTLSDFTFQRLASAAHSTGPVTNPRAET